MIGDGACALIGKRRMIEANPCNRDVLNLMAA